MICPYCANEKTTVRDTVRGFKNIRLRKCPKCHNLWRTEETPIADLGMVDYLEYMYKIGEISKEKYELSLKSKGL